MQHTREITEVLIGATEVSKRAVGMLARASDMIYSLVDSQAPVKIMTVKEYRQGLTTAADRGVKLNYIVDITRENIDYCRELTKIAIVRHMDHIRGNFAVIDKKEYGATAVLDGQVPQLIYSNSRQIVEQHEFLFETLWNKAVPATQRIKELEEGIEPEFFNIITDTKKASDLLLSLAQSAKREIQFLLPNDKALIRMKNLGVLDALGSISNSSNGLEVRIICPLSDSNKVVIDWLKSHYQLIQLRNGIGAQMGIIIVDNTKFLGSEMINPSVERFSDAIGVTLFSNNGRTINLLKIFFEALWTQSEVLEKLEAHDKFQKDFINIAAHELRTPIQPILGVIEMLNPEFIGNESQDHGKDLSMERKVEVSMSELAIIIRNVKRLERLSSDILTAARIDSGNMNLRIEKFDIKEKISSVASDLKGQMRNGSKSEIVVDSQSIIIAADKSKIFEVLSNLLRNSIKFTTGGTIKISAERSGENEITVKVVDTGSGIDPEIMRRLFTKFASKSEQGTGLGLFISKSIIEAHGGRIWGENNFNGKGATFGFTLPIESQKTKTADSRSAF